MMFHFNIEIIKRITVEFVLTGSGHPTYAALILGPLSLPTLTNVF